MVSLDDMKRAEKLYLKGTHDKSLIVSDLKKLEQAHTIMGHIRLGKSHYTIALEMGISTQKVRSISKQCMEEFTEDIQSAVASARSEILIQIAAVIEQFMPIAQSTYVDELRISARGEPFTAQEWKHSIAAGELVLKALGERAKLMGCTKVEQQVTNNHNSAFFMAGDDMISKLVASQPQEVFSESSKEIDVSFIP